jgi:predicted aspartyl protease
MMNVVSFDYDTSYSPPAPFLPIAVDGYDPDKPSLSVAAFVDSGADGTMLPEDILQAVGAEYEDTVQMRGSVGGVQRADRYTVRITVADQTIHAISAVATEAGSEPLLGRDVLNHLTLTLNGPAEVLEMQAE